MSAAAMFPPTLEAALARLQAVRPGDYARTRNAIDGAVTRLSPYITHGFVSLPQVLQSVAERHRFDVQHKFVFELGWREYFHHVWQHRGDEIFQSLHEGPLPESTYSREVPEDIRQARTGLPVIDQVVRTLYATGYLHNHARMWLASYVVHLRKVHWRDGADWMVSHLVDGDLASNHLSWQWVAGTGSHKPYLFNAENVARYAPKDWHSPGTVVDTSYEALDAMARSPRPVLVKPHGAATLEPPVSSMPPSGQSPRAADVQGREVWLVHPWAMGEMPADLPPGSLRVGWWPSEHHRAWPWSFARWAFVDPRMAALTDLQWFCSAEELAQALQTASSVHAVADLHVANILPPWVHKRQPMRLFAPVNRVCHSFSAWWNRSTREIKNVSGLPGLAARLADQPAGPLFQ